jgi:alkaline phosphatase D
MLARTQLAWLEAALAASTATWKIIACDQPLGLVVPDGPLQEGFANADPKVLGRELEVAALLAAIKRRKIRNLIWVTADVHYAAAHHYDPAKATFTDFDPFWEFVAGPLHAGTFGPSALDPSFGPQAVFTSVAPKPNRPPSDNLQFFGLIDIDPATKAATVTLHTRDGKPIYTNTLAPAEG